MPHHMLNPQEVFDFITNDFESAWMCLASSPDDDIGRGNFLFALQATVLLEWVIHLCRNDVTASEEFADELYALRPRYFLTLPVEVGTRVAVPHRGSPKSQLLTVIFDLVRNGLSHRYQQISARLADGNVFAISLGGAQYGNTLATLAEGGGSDKHLASEVDESVVWLYVDAGILYWDIKTAIINARLLSRELQFSTDFSRDYMCSIDDLAAAI